MDLLDADILIDIQRKHPPAMAWYAGLTVLPAASGTAVLELVRGALNGSQMQAALDVVAPWRWFGRRKRTANRLSGT